MMTLARRVVGCCLFGLALADACASEEEAVSWALAHALALPSCSSSLQAADLDLLDPLVQSARVVGLGEGTHGAHEFLVLRNRLFQYLVENHGFTRIIVETHPVHAEQANAYVQGEAALTQDMVEGVFSANRIFAWHLRPYPENRALLEWMRAHNARSSMQKRVHFHGMDERHPFPAAPAPEGMTASQSMGQHVLQLLDQIAPGERVFVFAHNGHLHTDGAGVPNTLGTPLRVALGERFKAIGTIYDLGWLNDYKGKLTQLPPAQAHTLNELLARVGLACFALDLHASREPTAGINWFAERTRIRGSHWMGQSHYFELIPRAAFDAVIFINGLTPVGAIPEPDEQLQPEQSLLP